MPHEGHRLYMDNHRQGLLLGDADAMWPFVARGETRTYHRANDAENVPVLRQAHKTFWGKQDFMSDNDYANIQWGRCKPDADYAWLVDERYPIRSTEQLTNAEVEYIHAEGDKLFNRVMGAWAYVDGEELEIYWDVSPSDFERIRRITGYLVGTLDRFNDAKAAEERERVKHNVIRGDAS